MDREWMEGIRGFCLHRAPLVVPVGAPVVEDGGVLTCGGRIAEVGAFKRLKKQARRVYDHEGAVLVPGLINCHTHLELSFLRDFGRDNDFFEPGDITAWIYALVHARAERSLSKEEIKVQASLALEEMAGSGVVALADIGNLAESAAIFEQSLLRAFFFLEAFGLSGSEIPDVEKRLALNHGLAWTGHALYSTHPDLVRRLKKRSLARGDIFPIHTAESADEIEFLKTGKGPFAEFLEKRLREAGKGEDGRITDIYSPPGVGALAYLAKIGCLDEKTLCVHCVHVENEEIKLLSSSGAGVCLCPGSNEYLGVGKAPVAKLVEKGVRACLGTDSLASNPGLSIWREMKIIAMQNPGLDPEVVFKMATANGADILGITRDYGGLSSGRRATMLAVKGTGQNRETVYEQLVHAGEDVIVDIIRGGNDCN